MQGSAPELGLSYQVVQLGEGTKILLLVDGKEIRIHVKDSDVSVKGILREAGRPAFLSTGDKDRIARFAEIVSKKEAESRSRKLLLRVLNLLHSWPENLPLQYEASNIEAPDLSLESYTSACQVPPPLTSESICSLMGQESSGNYISSGWPTGISLGPVMLYYPGACTEFPHTVEPSSLAEGDCFGRCGVGCEFLGEDDPVYTQNCFNHDGCVDALGRIHPYCNQMFLYCAKDFLLGEECAEDVPMEFVWVSAGTFQMGDTFGDGYSDEYPVHTVTLTKGFYLGKYEVTQAQWQAVMGSNPSNFQPPNYPDCPTCPVETVSWDEVQDFIATLNARTGKAYRLPTEAEWEYSASYGSPKQKYAGTSDDARLGEYAWYWENSGSVTHPVGEKLPNELGLHDMSGNVWEWVQDWYGAYPAGGQTDPTGPVTGSYRVVRGGCWIRDPWYLRSAYRHINWPGYGNLGIGLRLVLPQ
ncbi:MAG: formylglycine-generating enzyme family protein [Deltaproteobacteria bacterium]|nr:formylglycine-generating enzyme family protein [Deltaproteobacteria bacterium]